MERVNKAVKSLKNQLWFLGPSGAVNRKRLKQIENIYEGKRCFIMGNGPSLLKNNLSLLNNEITIASNAQYLIWKERDFIPKFLTVEDRLVAEDRGREIDKIENVTKIFPKDLSYAISYTSNTIYIDFLRNYQNFPKFSENFSNKVYWGGTVSYLNMQLAYYLGCREIYMIGFDHSYKVPEKMNNTVITSETEDVNHIHPDYFGKGYRWHDPNVERMETAYEEAKRFFELKGVKIFNATVGGQLEVFERVQYDTLFNN
ncbi:6-hydroxymethylpterin diphosphokinase MptE-like protein [Mucilaginibacter sp. X4EP1]|uniref:6-hydroxymethylpterin diphosphokinase MptE-like protein n=1 Tax=Mucilaginibacter sp. X4EP1 TaxID=2723092 RepID=UPI002169A70E|nr:6-hydroxymethylpterin diphosphokinase MptE-like protein [Mucilaginibacter sp. X4EP1]MCS3812965.1 hypothetical protein [Mucilaginibacter sp. X4EP1]